MHHPKIKNSSLTFNLKQLGKVELKRLKTNVSLVLQNETLK